MLAHILATVPPVRSVLILTDGYTGKPLIEHVQAMHERRIKLYAVMPYESANPYDLRDFAKTITILPPLRRSLLPGRS